jgi:hypothetical protein
MFYEVRWRAPDSEQEYKSCNYASRKDATDFACGLLNQMAVANIWIVDGGGHSVVQMPEISRHCLGKKAL